MAPTEGCRVARPERRWSCCRGTPPPQKKMKMGQYFTKIWIELCGLLFWATLKTEQRSGCIWLMAVLIKVRTDTTDFTNMRTAGIKRQIIKNKTKVAGRMSACIE